jgi:mevalonate kinase
VAGVLAYAGVPHDLATLDRLAFEVERRQHGLPSGIDHLAVLRGGVLWATQRGPGTFAVEPLTLPEAALSRVHVLHTGTPAESTGAVVAAVRGRLQADPARYEPVLGRMAQATARLRERLAATDGEPAALLAPIRDYERGLEELGVVPEAVRRIVRQVEAAGGAAKVSGAGALSGSGAGCLLVYHPSPPRVDEWSFLQPLRRYDVPLGVEGLRMQG